MSSLNGNNKSRAASIIELLDSSDEEDENNDVLRNTAPIFSTKPTKNNNKKLTNNKNLKPPPPSSTTEDRKPTPAALLAATAAASAAATTTTSHNDDDEEEVLTPIGTTASSLQILRGVAPVSVAAAAVYNGEELSIVRDDEELATTSSRKLHADNIDGVKIGYFTTPREVRTLCNVLDRMNDKVVMTAIVDGTATAAAIGATTISVTVHFKAKGRHLFSKFELKPIEDKLRKVLSKGGIHLMQPPKPEPTGGGGAVVPPRRVTRSPIPPTTTSNNSNSNCNNDPRPMDVVEAPAAAAEEKEDKKLPPAVAAAAAAAAAAARDIKPAPIPSSLLTNDENTAPYNENTTAASMLPTELDPQGLLAAVAAAAAKAINPSAGSKANSSSPEVLMSTTEWEGQNMDQLDEMFDKQIVEKTTNLPNYPMPALLSKLKLFDHQIEGIRWLIHQERGELPSYMEETTSTNDRTGRTGQKIWRCKITKCGFLSPPSPVRGGILADEMGLGKTLQTIGLILSHPPRGIKKYPIPSRLRNGRSNNARSHPRCTLIVSPLTVMANWKLEINKHVNNKVNNKNLTVSIYHGPNREQTLIQVKHGNIDVLLASYHTLASDYKKYFEIDEDDAEAVNSNKKPPAKKKQKKVGPNIFEIRFHRIVLDEAHIIRSSKTGLYKAAAMLEADRRLCLTGTPFVNKPTDIHSLLSFLGVQPLAEPKVFEKLVVNPIKSRRELGLATIRTTMGYVSLRRIKNQVDKNIDLVKKTIHYTTITFPPENEHKKVYDDLYMTARDCFMGLLRMGDDFALSRFMEILALVLRIRQACVHLALIPEDYRERAAKIHEELSTVSAERRADEAFELGKEEGEDLLERIRGFFAAESDDLVECAVCLGELQENEAVILRKCKHIYCEACLRQITNSICPMCRCAYTEDDMIKKTAAQEASEKEKEKVSASIIVKKHGRSPKVQAMLDSIDMMAPNEKAVIFSQWTSVLDIIECEFRELGHTFTRIDGTMSAQERYDAMEAFDTEGCDNMSTPRFILCSLHACGTGINLTRGNVVFLFDPWWNVAAENQAMDRVHRISQKRPVRVYRLVMKDSIEERLVQLQESKAALGKGAMERLGPEEKRKARLTALRDLFQVPQDEEWN